MIQLKALCRAQSLQVTGTKNILTDRLSASDLSIQEAELQVESNRREGIPSLGSNEKEEWRAEKLKVLLAANADGVTSDVGFTNSSVDEDVVEQVNTQLQQTLVNDIMVKSNQMLSMASELHTMHVKLMPSNIETRLLYHQLLLCLLQVDQRNLYTGVPVTKTKWVGLPEALVSAFQNIGVWLLWRYPTSEDFKGFTSRKNQSHSKLINNVLLNDCIWTKGCPVHHNQNVKISKAAKYNRGCISIEGLSLREDRLCLTDNSSNRSKPNFVFADTAMGKAAKCVQEVLPVLCFCSSQECKQLHVPFSSPHNEINNRRGLAVPPVSTSPSPSSSSSSSPSSSPSPSLSYSPATSSSLSRVDASFPLQVNALSSSREEAEREVVDTPTNQHQVLSAIWSLLDVLDQGSLKLLGGEVSRRTKQL